MKYIIPLLTLFTFLIFVPEIRASEVKPFLVTDHREFLGTPHLPTILYYKTVTVPWKSGKVFLAGQPDGTGAMDVGVQIEVYGSDTSKSFKWYAGCDEKVMQPLDITHLMGPRYAHLGGDSQVLIRFNRVFCNNWIKDEGVTKAYYDIGPVYLVHFDDAPGKIEPFLNLPWGYTSTGKSFEESALAMSSYFDHAYPLLSSSALLEPENVRGTVTTFQNKTSSALYYSRHDGYDWARAASVKLGDPVYAAAAGIATFRKFGECGNMIMIDHGNDFQTRYCHLDDTELITKDYPIEVTQGQKIGKVGMTGRTTGPHIHFMVVQDKDRNGSFDDNIPDGIVDPFGWWSDEQDPWEVYEFEQGGEQKTGNRSQYLWQTPIVETIKTVGEAGATIIHGSNTVSIPFKTVSHDVIFELKTLPPVPRPTIDDMLDGVISSIGNAVEIQAHDGFDKTIATFSKLLTITMKLNLQSLNSFVPESISIYSSADGINWQKEATQIDLESGTATTQVNHLTQFAIMGERIDSAPPITELIIQGNEEAENMFLKEIQLSFSVKDGEDETSTGVENTFVRINDGEMMLFVEPIKLNEPGEYRIEYYSVDYEGNEEELGSRTVSIVPDPTPTPTMTPTPTATPTVTPTPSQPVVTATLTPTMSRPKKHHVYIPKVVVKYAKNHKVVIKTIIKKIQNFAHSKHIVIKYIWK